MVRSPVEICLGTRPNQAAKSRPLENASPAPTRDDRSDARNAHQPLATGILARKGSDLARQAFDPLIQPTPVAGQILDQVNHARRQHRAACRENAWQPGTQEAPPLSHRDPTLQEEGADLIDDTGTLADQTLPHPVQRLRSN